MDLWSDSHRTRTNRLFTGCDETLFACFNEATAGGTVCENFNRKLGLFDFVPVVGRICELKALVEVTVHLGFNPIARKDTITQTLSVSHTTTCFELFRSHRRPVRSNLEKLGSSLFGV